MFTGIVTDIGEIVGFTPTAQGQLHRLRIACRYDQTTIADGASIACNGVCLTVVASGVEGGSRVAASFVAADLVDEIWLFRGAEEVGSRGVDALDALPLSKITQSQAYKVHASETFDKDTLTIYERA